jgi:hypothetical protein
VLSTYGELTQLLFTTAQSWVLFPCGHPEAQTV